MPIRRFNDDDIKRITEKYVHGVRRNPEKIPNIQNLIEDAIHKAAPSRPLDQQDVVSVISKLAKRPTISDKIIAEVTKEVIDRGAMEDLRHQIRRNAKEFTGVGRAISDDEVDHIIKTVKLTPDSSLSNIRNQVRQYFTSDRPLTYLTPVEIQAMIRKEMAKEGPVDERDLKTVSGQYMEKADQDKPFDVEMVRRLVADFASQKKAGVKSPQQQTPQQEGPKKTPTSQDKSFKASETKVKAGPFVPPKDPSNLTFFEKIRLKMRRYGIKSLSRGARNWLNDEVSSLSRVNRKKLLAEGETVAEAFIGKMFLYYYDAKLKKELPYWDKFPLIFVIELYDDGWLGLNMHYLDRTLRMKLFDKLLQFANDKALDKITKLRLSYGLLKSVSQYPEVRPTIKRYLVAQVRSELLPIDPVDWETALFLPVEQFQKEKKETVWKRSREKISYLKKFRR